ncbi:hypothetical protein J14TS2_04930 [Bacillus sp. J14TS2]|nr:anti-repressor SinI family protein [Bacillus sp. J14TS2]GIN70018.1 hypothetical protein J14TS2_04930 [Bacillus sp. J14TS2]
MLDPEWVSLMLQAKEIGLTLEEVKDYIDKKAESTEVETTLKA